MIRCAFAIYSIQCSLRELILVCIFDYYISIMFVSGWFCFIYTCMFRMACRLAIVLRFTFLFSLRFKLQRFGVIQALEKNIVSYKLLSHSPFCSLLYTNPTKYASDSLCLTLVFFRSIFSVLLPLVTAPNCCDNSGTGGSEVLIHNYLVYSCCEK